MQRGCQFFLSQNRCWSPRCGVMWSTTVALVYLGGCSFKHSTQKRCSCRNSRLAFCHLLPYPRREAERVTSGWSGRCLSQYIFPGSTSSGQPGWWQGFLGLYGIGLPHFSFLISCLIFTSRSYAVDSENETAKPPRTVSSHT